MTKTSSIETQWAARFVNLLGGDGSTRPTYRGAVPLLSDPTELLTPLEMALRDCRLTALAVVGVALEVGVEPTVRHAADLGLIPVVVTDACGSRDQTARTRVLDGLAFAGDAMFTDAATLCALLERSRVRASP